MANMSIRHLVAREIYHRKLNFAMAALSVTAAVGCLIAEITLLRAHDIHTDQIIAAKQAETAQRMAKLEDDYRKITKKLGFNVLILPKDQNLADLYADDYASKYMPEAYVRKLAESNIMTVNHLLPILQQKLKWPEKQRTIILVGTRGEVPILHRDPSKPLLVAVPRDTAVLGYELHKSMSVAVGDKITLLGKDFEISKCHPERGSKDDITIWLDLAQAQELLDKQDKVNAIYALSCQCAEARLAKIRDDIGRILPDTHVIEFASQAVTRAEVRDRAAVEAKAEIEAEKLHRANLRQAREAFAAWLVPLVLVVCVVWLSLLAFGNVRQRRSEIGILRAIGLRSRDVLALFAGKAALVGLVGAVLGYAAGLIIGWASGEVAIGAERLLDPGLLVLAVLLAPVLSGLASCVPAIAAAQQDPAAVLQEE